MLMGAHVAWLARAATPTLVLALAFVMLSIVAMSLGSPESDSLLKFKEGLVNNEGISNWNSSVKPCDWDRSNWIGVICLNGSIWGLQLEHMGLAGTIDLDSLLSLPYFRTISLMDNNFDGALPDVKKLGKLKALYLSNNRFSGQIPDNAFEGMGSLKRVFLANNDFTGKIPVSLTTLPKLVELKLEGNQFQGQIPNFQQKGLKTISLASNELEGQIPESLSRFSPNSFSGNKGLCGTPLDPCKSPPPSSPTSFGKKNNSNVLDMIIIIILGILLAILVAICILMYCRKRKQLFRTASADSYKDPAAASYDKEYVQHDPRLPDSIHGGHLRKADHGKLSFVRNDVQRFDLQDLLRASAEVLGSGTFGASYKAVVMSGQALVVKRYRHMNNVGREEFHEHMRRLGRLKHPNLHPIVAYYYRKEEKLLVSEFVDRGSLASHLHGNHSIEEDGLDWRTRLRIIKGVAKGLAYIYTELPMMIVPHGHLKSSNVLLSDSMDPLLTDYGLRAVINPEHAHMLMMSYKSPEYAQHGRTSNKTDIWSLGTLILEVLTGKFPENYLTQGYDPNADLATWVNNMVKEKRMSDIFDKEMMGTKNSKGEMISLLKIGLSCCEENVESRLDIKEVVDKIEELKEGDGDHHEEYNYGSEGHASSVRGQENDLSFTLNR